MSQNGPSLKKLFAKKLDEEKVEEEILSMVEEGHEQGIILEDEAEMISNIFEFADKEAKDIMTSRNKIIGIESNMLIKDALDLIISENYSRYPVFEDDIDNIIGVLHLKDVVVAYLKNAYDEVKTIMDKPIFIHPTYNISKLLKKMQSEKIHMSIVVDEYGQTEGLVAMEDIIEEIIGNILDEHDEEEDQLVRTIKDGTYIVKGLAKLQELDEIMEIDFPDEDFETLNGFLLYQLGRLPVEGEEIEIIYQGYIFTPLETSDKMIKLVKIIKSINEEE